MITSAVLELFGSESVGAAEPSITIAAYPVADSSWDQGSITYNNAPTIGAAPIAGVTISGETGRQYMLDLTAYLQQQQAAGVTEVSIALRGTANTLGYVQFDSTAAASGMPELVLNSPTPTPTPVPSPTPTPTPAPTPTPTPVLTVNSVTQSVTGPGPTGFMFTVTLSTASASPVMVTYSTANGPGATAPTEYQADYGHLTFEPGQVVQTFTVEVNKGPHPGTADDFYVFIYDALGAGISGTGRGVGTVL